MYTMRRGVLVVCTSAIAGLLLAGCSSATPGSSTGAGGGSSAPGSEAVSSTPADTQPASGPADTDSASSPSQVTVTVTDRPTSPPVTPAGCSASQLTVTATPPPAGGAAGHEGVVVLFRNHGSTTCTLTGYPGAAGLNASGAQIAQATRTLTGMIGGCHCSHAPLLTLNPGTTVSAVIEGNIGGPGPCDAFHSLLVTPPNTSTSTHLAVTVPSCGFDVHPVVTGTSGGGPS